MNSGIDGVLVVGFGGPEPGCCGRRAQCPKTPGCEAECFVSGILGDSPARAKRVAEVAAHYRAVGGGFSPYNPLTRQQVQALERELAARGRPLPVEMGLRHWTPWVGDGLRRLGQRGCRRAMLLILAPQQSSVSWDWYIQHTAEATEVPGYDGPQIAAVGRPFFAHPGYIAAIVAELRAATAGWPAERVQQAALVFTAHAIPAPVERTSPYRQQVVQTAALAAAAFGHAAHTVAFQSQPGDSSIPWSSPSIEQVIAELAAQGARDLLLQPCGFLVDHTEVVFDLDVAARQQATGLGLGYTRARSVHDQPGFIGLLADEVAAVG